MPQLDFTAIKQAVTIDEVATYLDLVGKRHGDQVRGACPACKSGGDRTLVITPSKGVFYCHNSKVGGDIFKLVMHIKGGSVRDAAQELADHFRVGNEATAPQSRQGTESRKQPAPTFDPDQYLANLDEYAPELSTLGLNPDMLQKFGGFCSKGILRGTLALALRDENGDILGFVGVPLDPPPKFPAVFKKTKQQ